MAQRLLIVCLIYLVMILQPTLGSGPTESLVRPWLPGVAIVFCLMFAPGAAGLVWSATLGLGIDCLSGNKLGINVVVATIIASSLVAVRSHARANGIITLALMAFWATFLWRWMATFAQSLLERRSIDVVPTLISAAYEGIASGVVLIVILISYRTLTSSSTPRSTARVRLKNQWTMLTGD